MTTDLSTGWRLNEMAKRLGEAMERLDPGESRGWAELSERERQFYEASLESALLLTDDDMIPGRAKTAE